MQQITLNDLDMPKVNTTYPHHVMIRIVKRQNFTHLALDLRDGFQLKCTDQISPNGLDGFMVKRASYTLEKEKYPQMATFSTVLLHDQLPSYRPDFKQMRRMSPK